MSNQYPPDLIHEKEKGKSDSCVPPTKTNTAVQFFWEEKEKVASLLPKPDLFLQNKVTTWKITRNRQADVKRLKAKAQIDVKRLKAKAVDGGCSG